MRAALFLLFIIETISANSGKVEVSIEPTTAEVIEFDNVTLTCIISGSVQYYGALWFIPGSDAVAVLGHYPSYCSSVFFDRYPESYAYTCIGNTTFMLTILNISLAQHGDKWKCGYRQLLGTFLNSSNSHIVVNVPVKEVSFHYDSARDNVSKATILENETVSINCTSSYTRPNTTIEMFASGAKENDVSVQVYTFERKTTLIEGNNGLWRTHTQFYIQPNRTLNRRWIFCIAINMPRMTVTSKSLLLDIKYPPSAPPLLKDVPNGSVYYSIEGELNTITCTIGNSNPMSDLTWSCDQHFYFVVNNINETSKNLTWTSRRNNSAVCACQSFQEFQGKRSVFVNIDYLYPPENIVVSIHLANGTTYNITNTISVIEHTSVSLSCSAQSRPPPSRYSWTGIYHSEHEVLNFEAIRTRAGVVTCEVFNEMHLLNRPTVMGLKGRSHRFDVLYPPVIIEFRHVDSTEGTNIIEDCLDNPGFPTDLSVIWKLGNTTASSQRYLVIRNATVNDSGLYNCSVFYKMKPSYGNEVSRMFVTSIMLNVDAENKNGPSSKPADLQMTAAVIAGAFAGGFALAAVTFGTALVVRQRRLSKQSAADRLTYYNIDTSQDAGSAPAEMSHVYEGLKRDELKASENQYQDISL